MNEYSLLTLLRIGVLTSVLAIWLTACDISQINATRSLPDLGNRVSDTPAPLTTALPDESPRGGVVINLPPTWTPAPAPSLNQPPRSAAESPQALGVEVTTYAVQVGDTLAEIAIQFDVPMELLVSANDLVDPDHIEVGQILVIPPQ